MKIQDLILLRKLKLHPHPIDYVLSEDEGAVLYFRSPTSLSFQLKTLTNSFTPGLFQYICAACATMGAGRLVLDIDVIAQAGLDDAFNSSELKKACVDELSYEKHTQFILFATVNFNYDHFMLQ